ncbi:Dirigent protein [Dillenia turbinata]|uniref:Dirigent protein n=1 Tax=Dillenia turbinata TaxID=194707 RepID=A0AAN8UPF2_9MAGN
MARKTPALPTQIFLLFLLKILIPSTTSINDSPQLTNMVVYVQDKTSPPNATEVPVAGIAGNLWSFTSFGTIYVIDDDLTTTVDRNSPQVGFLRGIYIASALDGSSVYVSLSMLFTNGFFSGSTLELQGTSVLASQLREVAVVSGTGKFRFARGYATFETVFVDTADDNITTTIDRNSDMIDHAHGIYVASTLDVSGVYVAMSILFTCGDHKGSTIELQGSSVFEMEFREVAMVSGTGKFRFAEGYATRQTTFVDQVMVMGQRLNITRCKIKS